MSRFVGLLLILAVLVSLGVIAFGISVYNQATAAFSNDLRPLQQDLSAARAQLEPVWQDLTTLSGDVTRWTNAVTDDLNTLLNNFPTKLPAFSLPVPAIKDDPLSPAGTCDPQAITHIIYPSNINLTKTTSVTGSGQTNPFAQFLSGVGVSVNVTVPDLSNAVKWRCIDVFSGGSVTFDPSQLPDIPGLAAAQKLFTDTSDFLAGKVNGVNRLIARIGALAKPLQTIDSGLNDLETLRSHLETIQQSDALGWAVLGAKVLYGLCALLGFIQGLRMLLAPIPKKAQP